jgi:hypothetical protein
MRNLDWRTKAFLVGGAVGAVLGLSAAYIYVNSVEKEGVQPELQPAEAVGIGLALLAVLRQIANLHEGDGKKKKQLR